MMDFDYFYINSYSGKDCSNSSKVVVYIIGLYHYLSPDGVMIDWSKKEKGASQKDGKDQQPRGISHPSEDPSFGTPKCKSIIETCDHITN